MIPYGCHHIDDEDIQAVVDVLRNGFLTQGPLIEKFEQAVATYVGVKYALAVSSGTAGLHLAALAAGVGPKKTLITSPMTFVASANAALYAGGRPDFADIDPDTINISPSHLRESLSRNPDVRAIAPVHFAGLPCNMQEIKSIADESGAIVIEDAAHALGSQYPDGKRVGCCADSLMTIFSFHPVKAIAAGEGGMITTNDEHTYRKLLRLRSHGIGKLNDPFQQPEQADTNGVLNLWYYEMQELGYNYRITDIQCALALSQLKKLENFVEKRRKLVQVYDKAFADMANCRPAQITGRDQSGHHLYILRIDFNSLGRSRAQLMQELRDRQIITQVHYIPVPAHPYYRNLGFKPENYPNALNYYKEALSIPLFYDLTDEQQHYVISIFKELVG
jgi:UDP-4-amino-4,6-dideoxy-N-acetyl-beta-L-altrosamine transaminase